MDAFEKVIYWLIVNSLGGLNRGKILKELFKEPQNANNLSKNLSVEYKTIRYHLKVLKENNLVVSVGNGYGKTYFPSDNLEGKKSYFEEIWYRIGRKIN